jgi:hypothetical protein
MRYKREIYKAGNVKILDPGWHERQGGRPGVVCRARAMQRADRARSVTDWSIREERWYTFIQFYIGIAVGCTSGSRLVRHLFADYRHPISAQGVKLWNSGQALEKGIISEHHERLNKKPVLPGKVLYSTAKHSRSIQVFCRIAWKKLNFSGSNTWP